MKISNGYVLMINDFYVQDLEIFCGMVVQLKLSTKFCA